MNATQEQPELDLTQPLSIDDAMDLAMNLHHAGHHEDAYKIYSRVLELEPNHPDALHFMGIMAHQRGCDEDAIRLMSHSVDLRPDHAGFRSNLGNLLLDNERFEAAQWQYCQALVLDPDRPDALNNLAVLCKELGRYEEAERYLRQALDLSPDFTDARNNLARLYSRMGRIQEAVEQASEALVREPRSASSREMLGYAYCKSGQFDAAAKVYREWLADEPDHPTAVHHLAACTGQGVPPRASDAYVQSVFDAFSARFDARLANLEYRAPQLLAEAVAACLGAATANLEVLDAGCGTGLCAPLLKPFASRLTGVDLSSGMLNKARARTLYDTLRQAELTADLWQRAAGYDLIVSADTLVYFGELDETMRAAAHALRPGGHLCFTVEALAEGESGDYRLQHHGRYAHSRDYLEATLAQAGFAILTLERVVPRCEGGEPVAGWLALAQRRR
ncbi:tetratricopeptide repeat protein [Thiocystis violascens]|nr:tetratricopeptide repeat protein [Thiocystis violascens]